MDAWSYSACRQLAKTYLSTMQYPEAVEQAKRALDINAGRRRRVMAEYASALAAAGQAEQAKKYLRQITGTGWDEPLPSYELAVLHLRLGDRESALRSLAGAMQRKLTRVIWLRHDPEFDPLRADPRFQQSVRPLGASPLP